jgi:hypothetical protein
MTRDRGRLAITGGAVVLALAVLLFPPWSARAIRTTSRYASVPGVAPATLVDTVRWSIRVLPLFAPPHPAISGAAMRDLAARAQSGDTVAKRQLVRLVEPFERRVGAPEILRTSGELWRDSVLAVAGMPSVSSYQASFALDDLGIALRLAAVALIALFLDRRRPGARSSRGLRGRGHTSDPTRA